METTFDLFRQQADGKPLWVKAVQGLEESKRQLTLMSEKTPGDYFIFDIVEAKVIARICEPLLEARLQVCGLPSGKEVNVSQDRFQE